jgi:hypothetical protein
MFLQNPFEFGAMPLAPDEAAVSPGLHASDTAADFSDIGEIFVGARKLEQIPGIFDQAAITPADELLYVTLKAMDDPHTADLIEMPYGMEGIFDPPPLFLRQAG